MLTTDASTVGTGAELAQEGPEGLKSVSYFNRVLSKTERKYSTCHRKFLADIMAVCHFRHHLRGHVFVYGQTIAHFSFLSTKKDPWGCRAR